MKVDLITGFLGSGKTTFIIEYAKHFISKGEKICIIENDFGAINVDMMMLDSLDCDKAMISGTSDKDCHKRRFKTKLIAAALSHHDRVIVEPSGLFDTDEFFDVMNEEPLDSLATINNVICMMDINTKDLSEEEKYFIVNEISSSSKIIVTKRENNEIFDISYFNQILKEYNSDRLLVEKDIIYKDKLNLSDIEYVGYKASSFIKKNYNNSFDVMYFMENKIRVEELKEKSNILFGDKRYGDILRIKGFIKEDSWYKINLTKENKDINQTSNGQEVFIIIGNNLNKEMIKELIG